MDDFKDKNVTRDGSKNDNLNPHGLDLTLFDTVAFRFDGFDIERRIDVNTGDGTPDSRSSDNGLPIAQAMKFDWLPEPDEVCTGNESPLYNDTSCPLCLAKNSVYRDHPLGDCYVCGADLTRKDWEIESEQAVLSEAARNERICQSLEMGQGLKYVPADGSPLGMYGMSQEVIGVRNMPAQQSSSTTNSIASQRFLPVQHVNATKYVRISQGDKPLSIYDEFMRDRPVVRPRSIRAQIFDSSPSTDRASVVPSAQLSHQVARGQGQEPHNVAFTQYNPTNPEDYYVQLRSAKTPVPNGSCTSLDNSDIHPLLRPDFNFEQSLLQTFPTKPCSSQQISSTQDTAAKQRLPPPLPASASAYTLPHASSRYPDTAPRASASWAPQHQGRYPGAAGKAPLYQGSTARYGSRPAYQVPTSRSLPQMQMHASNEMEDDTRPGIKEGDVDRVQAQPERNRRCCRRGLVCVRSTKGWVCGTCGCTTCFGWNSGSVG